MAQHPAAAIQAVSLPPGFDLLDLHAALPERYPFLLESGAARHSAAVEAASHDILFAFPGETLDLDANYRLHGAAGSAHAGFLSALDAWHGQLLLPRETKPVLPFRGGWFLFLGFELVTEIEPTIRPRAPPQGPVAFATRVPVALVRDRRNGAAWVVAEAGHEASAALVLEDLAAVRPPPTGTGGGGLQSPVAEPDPGHFLAAVERVRERIAAGDVYQVNLARHWRATVTPGLTPAGLYRRLRRANPAPFSGLATRGDWAVVSSSPERLVRCRGDIVETRPIAGTRPTADDPAQEDARRQDLLANPKERAEHVMLIDLERNDLGRVSAAGSVAVDEFMVVESYAHVHHIVSNILGRLRPGVSPGDVIRAMFPGGTITGCPKVRCLQIIAELEQEPRGPYTGSMGYLNRDGSCDLNILIRTFVLRGRELSFAAGSGIVADSDPARELDETRAKAKGLLLALEG
ncbi:MAG: aminodeoxychorismate synthase component I [Gammaproteobacteria bacterium]